MIVYDLRTASITLDEIVRQAADEPVHIISKDGQTFVLEPADAFEQEVAQLRHSRPFMEFLAERSKQKGALSLEQLEQEIAEELQRAAQETSE